MRPARRGIGVVALLATVAAFAAFAQPYIGPAQPGRPAQPARPAVPQQPATSATTGTVEPERLHRPPPTFDQMIRMPAVLPLAPADSAVVRRDLVYGSAAGRPLRFDLYSPAGATGIRGAIVFASGATDARGWAVFRSYGHLAAANGLVGIVYEKRYERSQPLEGAADTDALIDYLRDHGREIGVDGSRLVLWGFSAGGKLLGVGLSPRRPEIRAMIGFYPVLDLSAELPFYPDSLRERVRNTASPCDLLEARPVALPPTLIARAGLDNPELNSGIARFVRLALEANRPIELINVPAGRHAFDLLDPTDESRRAIRRALAFAVEHAGPRER